MAAVPNSLKITINTNTGAREVIETYTVARTATPITNLVLQAPTHLANGLPGGWDGNPWFNRGNNTWHHLLPLQFQHLFPATLDINSADYGVVLTANTHDAIHWAGWNDDWQNFFAHNVATRANVLAKLNNMCLDYHGVAFDYLPRAQQSYAQWHGQ